MVSTIPGIPGNQTPNPWVYRAQDAYGKAISISFPWNPADRTLENATIQGDKGCLYTTIYIGFGGDGKVTSSTKKINVPQGSGGRQFPASQLASLGLNTIDDILSSQITAAP